MGIRSWITWKGANLGYGLAGRLLWPRNSAAALVIDEDRLLAIDTGRYLMLPGGGLDRGENFEEAAKRETLEETGYSIEILDEVEESMNSFGGVEKVFHARLEESERRKGSTWEGKPVWIGLEDVENRKWRHHRDVPGLVEKVTD